MESDVGACGRAVDASGTIAVRLVVRVDGRISAAVVTGRLADTPLAICVERALKSIRFRGNDGISLTYPFFFKANASIPDCGGIGDGSSRKVDAAAMQHFSTMLGRCAGARAATVPVRLAMDEKGMIRAAEAQRPYAGTREGFCVERVLACVVGSFAARLPPAWEIGLEAGTRSAAKLRPITHDEVRVRAGLPRGPPGFPRIGSSRSTASAESFRNCDPSGSRFSLRLAVPVEVVALRRPQCRGWPKSLKFLRNARAGPPDLGAG